MKRDPHTDAPDFFALARDYLHTYMPTTRAMSTKTIEAYRISLENYLDYLATCHQINREDVGFEYFDRDHLKAWLAWMNDQQGYTPATIRLRLSAVKAFLDYAAAEDIQLVALAQAARTLRAPANPQAPIEYLGTGEIRSVLAAHTGHTAKSRRNRMLLILIYETAARVGELTALTLQDLYLGEPARVILTGKRAKTRVVPLANKTVEHLRVYLDEFHPKHQQLPGSRPLFYSQRGGQPARLSPDTVSIVLKNAADQAREICPSIPANIHCHLLRKTKAMDLYQNGIPLPIIMRLLGHENASTTSAFYAFATMDMMRDAIDAAAPSASTLESNTLNTNNLQAIYSLR